VRGGSVDRDRGRDRERGEDTAAVEQEFQTEASDEEGFDFIQWCIDLYDRDSHTKNEYSEAKPFLGKRICSKTRGVL